MAVDELLRFEGDMSEFAEAFSNLLKAANAKTIVINAPGQDIKVEMAVKRGDEIPFEPIQDVLVDGIEEDLASAAEGDISPEEVLENFGQNLEEGIRSVMEEGLVENEEPRTKKWERRKRNTKNLIGLTRDLVDSLEYEVVR